MPKIYFRRQCRQQRHKLLIFNELVVKVTMARGQLINLLINIYENIASNKGLAAMYFRCVGLKGGRKVSLFVML